LQTIHTDPPELKSIKPKLIYLYYLPLKRKWIKDFYIEEMIKDGFSVEYWDMSNIVFPDIEHAEECEREYIKKIENYKELKKEISAQNIAKIFFVVMLPFTRTDFKLHRILTKYDCYLIFFARSGLPELTLNESKLRKLGKHFRDQFKIKTFEKFIRHILWRISLRMGLLKNYDLVFAPGSYYEAKYRGISKVIPFNHYDFDNYLKTKDQSTRLIAGEYCVFLDDNLAYSADFKILNIKTIEPSFYLNSLNAFFDRLEKKFERKVVIAAHPFADYRGGEFGNREVISGKTNELVKDCRFALTHFSTSISYAVFYKKPLLFIYLNDMIDLKYFQMVRFLAKTLNSSLLKIDAKGINEKLGETEIKFVDSECYERYKYSFLVSKQTQNASSFMIFNQTINRLIKAQSFSN